MVCYGRRAIVSFPNMESPGGMGDSDSPVLTPAIVIHAGVSFLPIKRHFVNKCQNVYTNLKMHYFYQGARV